MKSHILSSLIACLSLSTSLAIAQQSSKTISPAEAVKDGTWEEMDQRLVFLMVRLANVETSLDAVEKAIGKSNTKRSASLGAAKRAEAGNELMDRKGGGPVKWSQFYGRTAEAFFYHPTDPNTSYHTTTVLTQQGSAADNKVDGGVAAGQGVPVHQRPPQFDYIYRANRDAAAKAEREAADSKNKMNELIARRAKLETEQSALWCEIAFRSVSKYDLARKPLYRFEPVAASSESIDRERAEALKAAALFIRAALVIVAEAEKDQARTFRNVRTVISNAREKLDDNWLRQTFLVNDLTTLNTPPGKFVALAKRLDDVSHNLSDSYEVSIDGDRFKDEQRKDTFRGLLQESLVSYAQLVLALDEMSNLMAREWKIRPNPDKPFGDVIALSIPTRASGGVRSSEAGNPTSASRTGGDIERKLAGTKWVNSNKITFEWTADGRFLHRGTEREWKALDGHRVQVIYSPSHKDTLEFNESFTEFKQLVRGGPESFQGKLEEKR